MAWANIFLKWHKGTGGVWEYRSSTGELYGLVAPVGDGWEGESSRGTLGPYTSAHKAADAVEADVKREPVPLPR